MNVKILLLCFGVADAVTIGSMEQGAAFDKCIKIEDFVGKGLDDDIELVERNADTGCCPADTVPGATHTNSYPQGPQIVCGFKEDGSVSFWPGDNSNGCTYNSCYVFKTAVPCAEGKQRLNGCCAAEADCTAGFQACGFAGADCYTYVYSHTKISGTDYKYCYQYFRDYSGTNDVGTAGTADDQADGKLVVDKLNGYQTCGAGGAAGSSDESDASGVTRMTMGVFSTVVSTATTLMSFWQ